MRNLIPSPPTTPALSYRAFSASQLIRPTASSRGTRCPSRVSDWTEVSSGAPIPIITGYAFNGSALPAVDYDDTFGALLVSSPAGQLQLQGVRHGGTSYGVFVNGLQLVANPGIQFTRARRAADGNLELTVQTQYAGQNVIFEQNSDLKPGNWQTALGGTVTQVHGPTVVVEFPFGASHVFYRAVSQ